MLLFKRDTRKAPKGIFTGNSMLCATHVILMRWSTHSVRASNKAHWANHITMMAGQSLKTRWLLWSFGSRVQNPAVAVFETPLTSAHPIETSYAYSARSEHPAHVPIGQVGGLNLSLRVRNSIFERDAFWLGARLSIFKNTDFSRILGIFSVSVVSLENKVDIFHGWNL